MDGEVQKTVTHSFVQRAFGALRRTVRLLLVTQLVQTTLVGAGGVVLRTSLHLYAVSFTKVTFYVTQRTSQNNIISMELWISSVKTKKKKKVNIGTFLTFKLFTINMLFILSCCTDWFWSQGNITTNKWTTWIIYAEFIWPECNRRYLTENSSLSLFFLTFLLNCLNIL